MKEAEIRAILQQHGYRLLGVTRFRHKDHVRFENKQVRITLNLRGHIEDFTAKQLEREL